MFEMIFLIVLALVWIVFASVQDLRTREVADWLNFSLIIFAIGFRFFYSLFSGNFDFFWHGLIGLGIFFVLGNLLYYGRMFAGGDAKLMIALGAVLPFTTGFFANLKIFLFFILLIFFVGGFYGFIWGAVLSFKNFRKFRKEFSRRFKKDKSKLYILMIFGMVIMVFGFTSYLWFYLGIFVFAIPYLYLYAKSVDEVCMVQKIKTKELRVGDWLYEDIKVGNKTIKKRWEGLNSDDISQIKKRYRWVRIKQGIPFVPVFFISFVLLLIFYKKWVLWNPLF